MAFSAYVVKMVEAQEARWDAEGTPEHVRLEWDEKVFGTTYVELNGTRIKPLSIHESMREAVIASRISALARADQ